MLTSKIFRARYSFPGLNYRLGKTGREPMIYRRTKPDKKRYEEDTFMPMNCVPEFKFSSNMDNQVIDLTSNLSKVTEVLSRETSFGTKFVFSLQALTFLIEEMPDVEFTIEFWKTLADQVDSWNQKWGLSFVNPFHNTLLCTLSTALQRRHPNRHNLHKSAINFVLQSGECEKFPVLYICVLELLIADGTFPDQNQLFPDLLAKFEAATSEAYKAVLATRIAQLLGRTAHWKLAYPYVNLVPGHNYMDKMERKTLFTPFIKGGLRDGDWATVLEHIDDMARIFHGEEKTPNDDLIEIFDTIESMEQMEQVLRRIRAAYWVLNRGAVNALSGFFHKNGWIIDETYLSGRSHFCPFCKTEIEPSEVTKKDTDMLFQRVHDRLIVGEDVHRASFPEEVASFNVTLKMLENMPPLDLVVDFRNIAMSINHRTVHALDPISQRQQLITTLRYLDAVIERLETPIKHVMLVSKGLDEKLLTRTLNEYRGNGDERKATDLAGIYQKWAKSRGMLLSTFFTQIDSEDDSFILALALKYGPDCLVFSNDNFRTAKCQLSGTLSLKDMVQQSKIINRLDLEGNLIAHLFQRWQQKSQLRAAGNTVDAMEKERTGTASWQKQGRRPRHMYFWTSAVETRAQAQLSMTGQVEKWHIPVELGERRPCTFAPTYTWLCLRKSAL